MRTAHMNGDDGFLRPHRAGPVSHGHRQHAKFTGGFLRKAVEDGR